MSTLLLIQCKNLVFEYGYFSHLRYECSSDGCWCHDEERLNQYIDDIDFFEEMGGNQFEKDRFRVWVNDLR